MYVYVCTCVFVGVYMWFCEYVHVWRPEVIFILLSVCLSLICAHACVHMHVAGVDSSHHVGSADLTQVVRLGSRCFPHSAVSLDSQPYYLSVCLCLSIYLYTLMFCLHVCLCGDVGFLELYIVMSHHVGVGN